MKTLNSLIARILEKLFFPRSLPSMRLIPVLRIFLPFLFCAALHAQTPVTAVFTHKTPATASTTYTGSIATGNSASTMPNTTYTYKFGSATQATNNKEILDSFTAIGLNYHFQTVSPVVKFRRVNNTSTTGLRKSLWIEENTTLQTTTLMSSVPDYDDSLERLFSGQLFNVGIDNNFQNDIATNNNNIERVDIIFTGGIAATTDLTRLGFAIFDRGAAGGHDPFVIAAIKTLDGSGNPSAYYPAVSAAATNYGNVASTSAPFNIFRKNEGDAKLLIQTLNTDQQRDGVFFTFSTLGIPASTTVYGYSLFSTDAPTTTSANMVNYAAFPTTTNLASGGLDQVAVTGVAYTKANFIVLSQYLDGLTASASSAPGGAIRLDWDLKNPENIKDAILERSGNGVDYLPLIVITDPYAGAHTDYDRRPLPAENYYRLKLENKDGAVMTYSQVCSIWADPDPVTAALVNLYPMPVTNRHFTLDVQGVAMAPTACRIFELNGRPVATVKLVGARTFSTEIELPRSLVPGVYLLQLTDGEGKKIITRSFLVK